MRRPWIILSGLALTIAVAIWAVDQLSPDKWIETDFVRVNVPPGWGQWITPETSELRNNAPDIVDLRPQMTDQNILILGFETEKYYIEVYRHEARSNHPSTFDRVRRAHLGPSETTNLAEFASWNGINGRGFDLVKTYPLPIHTRARLFEFKQGQFNVLVTVKAANANAEEANREFQKNIRTFEPLLSTIQVIEQ